MGISKMHYSYPTEKTVDKDPLPSGYSKTKPEYYKNKTEVWDFIIEYDLCFLSGNVIKYLTRYKKKNGIEDLLKARVYLDKLIQLKTGDNK